jgi:hypothetical protein
MPDLAEKVEQWNAYYEEMGRETPLGDLSTEAYEAEVAYGLQDVAGDWDTALAIFRHPDNKGGWMAGDVASFIERKVNDS